MTPDIRSEPAPRAGMSAVAANGRRVAIAVLAAALLAVAVAGPALLVQPTDASGRDALSSYRRWLVGELAIPADKAARLRDGFVVTSEPGRTVLAARDADGACWSLILPSGPAPTPLGPAPADDRLCQASG